MTRRGFTQPPRWNKREGNEKSRDEGEKIGCAGARTGGNEEGQGGKMRESEKQKIRKL